MNSLLEQLQDIEGLDSISAWPLAIGWWVLIAVLFVLVCGVIGFSLYRLAFIRSWKNDAFKKLDQLEKNLSDTTARDTLMVLSEYLRRIALRRFSRKECAALMGDAWLQWLTVHDPKKFDWETKGKVLNEAPYMPAKHKLPAVDTRDLIQAVRQWVR